MHGHGVHRAFAAVGVEAHSELGDGCGLDVLPLGVEGRVAGEKPQVRACGVGLGAVGVRPAVELLAVRRGEGALGCGVLGVGAHGRGLHLAGAAVGVEAHGELGDCGRLGVTFALAGTVALNGIAVGLSVAIAGAVLVAGRRVAVHSGCLACDGKARAGEPLAVGIDAHGCNALVQGREGLALNLGNLGVVGTIGCAGQRHGRAVVGGHVAQGKLGARLIGAGLALRAVRLGGKDGDREGRRVNGHLHGGGDGGLGAVSLQARTLGRAHVGAAFAQIAGLAGKHGHEVHVAGLGLEEGHAAIGVLGVGERARVVEPRSGHLLNGCSDVGEVDVGSGQKCYTLLVVLCRMYGVFGALSRACLGLSLKRLRGFQGSGLSAGGVHAVDDGLCRGQVVGAADLRGDRCASLTLSLSCFVGPCHSRGKSAGGSHKSATGNQCGGGECDATGQPAGSVGTCHIGHLLIVRKTDASHWIGSTSA